MAAAKDVVIDPAFQQGAGKKAGLEVWQTSNGRCFLQPTQKHGTFYTDQSYVILQTRMLQGGGGLHHEIHYWFGRCASQRDAALAALKSVELKACLGGGVVIAREVEGYESDKFLSYFKTTSCCCIIPLRQLFTASSSSSSSSSSVSAARDHRRLFLCRGRRAARITEVPFTRSSLNHDHVFVLDTPSKIFQFNGANSDVYERTKALDVVRCLKDTFHSGRSCHVAIIDDGPIADDIDKREFWSMFGGYAPTLRRITYDEDDNINTASTSSGTLYGLSEGRAVRSQSSPLRREMLSGYACYMLDCGKELFVWLSQGISQAEQKTAILLAEEWSAQYKNPWSIKLVCVVEGHEPLDFRSKFQSWPVSKTSIQAPQVKKGMVAVLLKQTGFNFKELLRRAPAKPKPQPHCKPKKLQIWCINGNSRECLPTKKQGKLYGNNCYVVYASHENRENTIFLWLGRHSTLETRATASYHVNDVAISIQENLVEVRVNQGKEPAQFLSLFDKLLLIKDEERRDDVALFQVQQSDASNWHAIQVTLAATSLNSSSCFFLQTGSIFYAWYGKFTTPDEQEATRNMVYHLKSDALLTSLKEGYETQAFWNRLGGRQSYPNHLEPKETAKEPRLLYCTVSKDRVKTTEIFNFTQEDLLSDEIMILDSFTSVFIWVGQAANPQHKMKALEFGQKYLEQAAKYEGISADTPIYIIQEGWEPRLFTSFFSWDPAKPKDYHHIFERKASSLRGEPVKQKEVTASRNSSSTLERRHLPPIQKSTSANVQVTMFKPVNSMEIRYQDAKAKAGFVDASGRDMVKPIMHEFHTGRQAPPNTPIVRNTLPHVRPKEPIVKECSPIKESSPSSPTSSLSPGIATLTSVFESYQDRCSFAWPGMSTRYEERAHKELESYSYERILEDDEETFISFDEKTLKEGKEEAKDHPYERLKVSSPNPVFGIDTSKRESYLSDQEFMKIFNMDKETFYKLPRWKQEKSKRLNDLF